MPLSPESKREAEKRLTVLKVIELFSDRCPKSTLLNGPFGGDDKAFDRWLGLMRRTYQIKLVMAVQEERATLYSRTEAGKVYQNMLDMQLNFLDPYTGGEVWENHTEARQTLSHLLLRSIIPGLIRIFSSCERFRFLGYNGIPRRTEYYLFRPIVSSEVKWKMMRQTFVMYGLWAVAIWGGGLLGWVLGWTFLR